MKLASVHFADLTPIPGTARRVLSLSASDGWSLERLDDARIRCERSEPVEDGGTLRLSFVLERWPVAYEAAAEPAPVVRSVQDFAKSGARGKR